MNSCVLMAEITSEPQLRYTQEGQVPITELTVQFPGLRAEEAAATLKVVGWGSMAEQIQSQYHVGDRVVIEGRLTMSTVERPEGFKEKRAELTASRMHLLGADTPIEAPVVTSTPMSPSVAAPATATTAPPAPATTVPVTEAEPATTKRASASSKAPAAKARPAPDPDPVGVGEPNFDEIPF